MRVENGEIVGTPTAPDGGWLLLDKGYQDVQNRVPAIANTMKDLGWAPKVDMQAALKHIFDAYRGQLQEARELAD